MVVIGDTGEEVVRPGRDVRTVSPLLALQSHVTLFLVVLEVVEQGRHAVAGGVLKGEGDEDEAHAEQPQLLPRDGVLLVEPLEG